MKPRRKQRLVLVSLLIAGVAVAAGLALLALQENINLFFSPSQVAAGEAPSNTPFRLGGMVVEGSIERSETDLDTTFWVTDYEASVPVRYSGILPDLFAEGEGVVAEGTLDESGMLVATQVLAKHDENYMPPEVAAALEGKAAPQGQPVLP